MALLFVDLVGWLLPLVDTARALRDESAADVAVLPLFPELGPFERRFEIGASLELRAFSLFGVTLFGAARREPALGGPLRRLSPPLARLFSLPFVALPFFWPAAFGLAFFRLAWALVRLAERGVVPAAALRPLVTPLAVEVVLARARALLPLFFEPVLLSEVPPPAADALARAGLVVARLTEALPVEVLVFEVFFWVDVRRAAIWMYP